MQVYRDFDKSYYDKLSVVTVGTFDGIHLGHRKIISDLNFIKSEKFLRSVIITFDPHPQLILKNKHKEIKLLSTTEEKLAIFESLGIDAVFIINFTEDFSKTSADDFYKKYLVEKVGFTDIVLGYDHNFGKNREGNFKTLYNLSRSEGFAVHKVEEFDVNGERINSTRIRNLLINCEIEKVDFLLGDKYYFSGKVVTGDKRGSTIGFPTANIQPLSEHKLIPGNGVYFVEIIVNGKRYFGMMNIGTRPTISEQENIYIEVNIFDFNKNIYNETIKIGFIKFIRGEKKFNSLGELITQLNADKEECIKNIK